MASIYTGNQYPTYGGGYIAKRAKTDAAGDEAAKTTGQDEDQTTTPELEAYKQNFVKKIKEKIAGRSDLERTAINLDITNEAFEKMRTDAVYEAKITGLIDDKVNKKYPLPPVSITVAANADGEDAAIDYGQSGEMFANRSLLRSVQRSVLKNEVNSMRNTILSNLQNGVGASSLLDSSSLGGTASSLGALDFYA